MEFKLDMKLFEQAIDILVDSGIIHHTTNMRQEYALEHVMKLYEQLYRSVHIHELPENNYGWADVKRLYCEHMDHRFEEAPEKYNNRFNWKEAVKQAESDTFKYLRQGFIDLDEHNNVFLEWYKSEHESCSGDAGCIQDLNSYVKEAIEDVYKWDQPPPEKYRTRIYWCLKSLFMLPCKHVSNDKE